MFNMGLIDSTVKEVNDYYEAEEIYERNDTIRNRATDWYNHTGIMDARTLAALTMWDNYKPISYATAEEIRDSFYPEDNERYYARANREYENHRNISVAELQEVWA